MQTASTDNDIEHVFDMPRLNKPSANAINADKFTGDMTLKEEKMLLQYRDFVEKYSEVIDKIVYSKPDEKKNCTIIFRRR